MAYNRVDRPSWHASVSAIFTIPVFDRWFERLRDRRAAARIQARIDRAESGNLGDCRHVGEGVSEMRIDCGPGTASASCSEGAR
jgi:putative addiction module killer protein